MSDTRGAKKVERLLFLVLGFIFLAILLTLGTNAQGNTITVDDDGGADHTSIQDAIDTAVAGDTILVYEGTYNENVVVDKSLELLGNDSKTTTIDAQGNGDVVKLTAGQVKLSGFIITGAGQQGRGVVVGSSHNNISHNHISSNSYGIVISYTHNNTLLNNVLVDNSEIAVNLEEASDNLLTGNSISGSNTGVLFQKANRNLLTRNSVTGNTIGLAGMIFQGEGSKDNQVHQNEIAGNKDYGIDFSDNNGVDINATDNWWGDVSGPYHRNENWQATGDNITDYVKFDPWYTGPEAKIVKIDPSPADEDEEVSFTGGSTRWADISLYVWTSDLDGELYNNTEDSFTSDALSTGEHELTLRIKDVFGLWSEEVEETLTIEELTTYLEGYVKDEDSQDPVEGAEVKLDSYETTTDGTGYYYLECEEGEFELEIKHDDYEDYSEQLTIEKGENTNDATLSKIVSYLEGYIKDEDSQDPVEGADVKLDSYETTTDDTGYYYLECEEGEFELEVKHDDYQEYSEQLTIEKGENTNDATLSKIVSYLEGYIKDEDSGDPVEGADVKLDSYETTTDGTGYYYLECEEGEFKLEVKHDDYEEYSEQLTIEKGENTNDATLSKIVSYLEGYIKDEDSGDPIQGATVQLNARSRADYETTSNDTGYFYIECEPGNYTVSVTHDDYQAISENITVEKGENEFEAELEAILTYLEGYIKDEDTQEPVEGAEVKLDSYETTTDSAGYYYLECEEGKFTFEVKHDDYEDHSTQLDIEKGENSHDAFISKIVTYLEGYVKNKDTQDPVVGAEVKLDTEMTITKPDGYYYLECSIGEFQLGVKHDDYEQYSTQLNIGNGENSHDAFISKIVTYLEGYVKDKDTQEPVVGVELKLGSYETSTDDTGYYYQVCPEGEFELEVKHDDYEDHSTQLNIEKGENRQDVDLTRIISYLEGNVKDKDTQEPVLGAQVKLGGYETTTDETGYYYLECEPGKYYLCVNHENYESYASDFTIGKRKNLNNVPLDPYYYYGYVKDENGMPIKGVSFEIHSTSSRNIMYFHTNDEGRYNIYEDALRGRIELYITHDDYKNQEIDIMSLNPGRNDFSLEPEDEEDDDKTTPCMSLVPLVATGALVVTRRRKNGQGSLHQ